MAFHARYALTLALRTPFDCVKTAPAPCMVHQTCGALEACGLTQAVAAGNPSPLVATEPFDGTFWQCGGGLAPAAGS